MNDAPELKDIDTSMLTGFVIIFQESSSLRIFTQCPFGSKVRVFTHFQLNIEGEYHVLE
jgi:hypothetical protein